MHLYGAVSPLPRRRAEAHSRFSAPWRSSPPLAPARLPLDLRGQPPCQCETPAQRPERTAHPRVLLLHFSS
ncbi:hypothetical protein VTN96DRAFT_6445 [Rasamsonia emersonii]